MAIDTLTPRSRRTVLAASLGALAASVAAALGRPQLVRAGSDGDVVLGALNNTANTTSISNSSDGLDALTATATGAGSGVYGSSQSGIGVYGSCLLGKGVDGYSYSGYGVYGYGDSSSSYGVYGYSPLGCGVYGDSESASLPAAVGQSYGGNTGVLGYSGTSTLPASPAKTGVYGYATQDASSVGVLGQSGPGVGVQGLSDALIGIVGRATAATGQTFGVLGRSDSSAGIGVGGRGNANMTGVLGFSGSGTFPAAIAKTGVYGYAAQDATARGVFGQSTSGRGVQGQASSGFGVRGYASTGVAGSFGTAGLKTGVALQTAGKVKFDSSVGLATIAAGTKSVVVTPGIDLTASSAVVATLQGNPGGTTTVQRVAVDTVADTFTIYLTANATANVKVAWHVFG